MPMSDPFGWSAGSRPRLLDDDPADCLLQRRVQALGQLGALLTALIRLEPPQPYVMAQPCSRRHAAHVPACLRYRDTASGANTTVIPIAHATAPHT